MTITETPTNTDAPPQPEQTADAVDAPVKVTRRRIDVLLIAFGFGVVLVLAVAGGLLTWGSNFAQDYVSDELAAQNISFPPAEALAEEGRDDLEQYGGERVDTGEEAEAYASYIKGHVDGIADGATFAEMREPQVAAEEALNRAIAADAPAAEIDELQAAYDEVSGQRESIYQGEILRGTLLNTYAWSTVGRIAGIAATVAFVAAALMALLVVAGIVHLRRHPNHHHG